MAVLAVTNTFAAGQSVSSSRFNTNFSDIVTWLNNRYNGTDTWLYMKVSSTVANPVDITSSAATTEVSVNNTATDGDPIVSWKLSGSAIITAGVDDSDSDAFKIGTTSDTTNVALQIPSTGSQTQFPLGSSSTPGISFIGQATDGFYSPSSGIVSFVSATTEQVRIGGNTIEMRGTTVLQSLSGTAAAPSLTFTAQQNIGVYRGGTSILGFATAGTQRVIIDANGSWIHGTAALNTTATDGFMYIESCNGTPTGVPTSYTGRVPLIYDTSAHKMWVYDSGWKNNGTFS